jgi:hypothetical protein
MLGIPVKESAVARLRFGQPSGLLIFPSSPKLIHETSPTAGGLPHERPYEPSNEAQYDADDNAGHNGKIEPAVLLFDYDVAGKPAEHRQIGNEYPDEAESGDCQTDDHENPAKTAVPAWPVHRLFPPIAASHACHLMSCAQDTIICSPFWLHCRTNSRESPNPYAPPSAKLSIPDEHVRDTELTRRLTHLAAAFVDEIMISGTKVVLAIKRTPVTGDM